MPDSRAATRGGRVKQYDQAYFDRWYRSRKRVSTPQHTRREAALALAAAEYLLERPVRRVLDVGCGEGQWRAVLRRLRPGLRWTGVDSSDYVVRRFGRTRNIRHGGFGDLAALGLRGRFDLVVASDVIHYVPTAELRRGLRAIVEHLDGVAWLEVHTTADSVEGDLEGWVPRSEEQYRRILDAAGLVSVGMHCWVPRRWLAEDRVGKMAYLSRRRVR